MYISTRTGPYCGLPFTASINVAHTMCTAPLELSPILVHERPYACTRVTVQHACVCVSRAGSNGGAINLQASSKTSLNVSDRVLFDGNEAAAVNGGAINTGSNVNVIFSGNVTMRGNSAPSGLGGAVAFQGLNIVARWVLPILESENYDKIEGVQRILR